MVMVNTASVRRIPITQLMIDTHNPRLSAVGSNQLETIRTITQTQFEKIVTLAKHIIEHGLNPAHLSIVMPAPQGGTSYVVLEGNRRVTALKLLSSPTLSGDVLSGKKLKSLKDLSADFTKKKISDINCVVFANRAEADTWIRLIHRGQQGGAGLVEWNGQVAARYDARLGNRRQMAALSILNFVAREGKLSTTTLQKIRAGNFPITTLRRLLDTPYVRENLGLDITRDGSVLRTYPKGEAVKGLSRVVDDVGTGKKTVSDIKNLAQRINYIDSLPKATLPKSAMRLASAVQLDATSDDPTSTAPRKKRRKQHRTRNILIPKDCDLNIDEPRINAIYKELQRLKVDEFPNAAAVLMRVFVEQSVDHYLQNPVAWDDNKIGGSKLHHRLLSAVQYMQDNKIMSKRELEPVRKSAAGRTYLAASIETMHAYVHNKHFTPVPSELITGWDVLQTFMENIWPD